MGEDLADDAIGQMPKVAGPDPFYMKTYCQLREHGLDDLPELRDQAASCRVGVGRPHPERGEYLKPLLFELGFQIGLPVVAVTEKATLCLFSQLRQHGGVRDIRWRDHEPGDPAFKAEPDMEAETVNGRLRRMIFPVSGETSEKAANRGADETAHRHREAVHGGDVCSRRQQLLPHPLLDLRQVRRLPHKGRPVDPPQSREPVGEMAAK